ncbi:MAG: hypothetical protein ACOX36_08020 [Saccharofermentanales bacterium]
MYSYRRHSVDWRIVSICHPHIRPIVRSRLVTNVVFGAKLALSLENGYARIEKLSLKLSMSRRRCKITVSGTVLPEVRAGRQDLSYKEKPAALRRIRNSLDRPYIWLTA